MQDNEDYFEQTSNLIKNYTEDRILLLKIQAAKKTGKIFSKLIFVMISVMLIFLLLLFISMMAGYYFADLSGSLYKGFSVVAGIYLTVLILFVILFRSYFSVKIMDAITQVFFEKEEDNSDE
ncbi:MAG: hypothetical protein K0S44_2616 [Bacteroidetes bacterium]|jgi:hypothetical protein|nr:hypothetical protein [Bacteroidota bacterium]